MAYMKCQTLLRGYIDHNKRISEMVKAGMNLEAWRRGRYDYPEGTSEDTQFKSDPTRNPGYDMADAHQDNMKLQQKIAEEAAGRAKEKAKNKTPTQSVSTGDSLSSGKSPAKSKEPTESVLDKED
jgi:hypothetical protein